MKHPVILESYYFSKPDAAINSKVLRAIFDYIMRVDYDADADSFTGMYEHWRIRIEDQHDKGEDKPHYVLDVGSDNCEDLPHYAYSVRYCDYHTKYAMDKYGNEIEIAPGRYTITIWVSAPHSDDRAGEIADDVADAYYEAMVDELPEYEIIISEMTPV